MNKLNLLSACTAFLVLSAFGQMNAQTFQKSYPDAAGHVVVRLDENPNIFLASTKNGLSNSLLAVDKTNGAQAGFEPTINDCDITPFGGDLRVATHDFFDHSILPNGDLQVRRVLLNADDCSEIIAHIFLEQYDLPAAMSVSIGDMVYNADDNTVFVAGVLQLTPISGSTQYQWFVKKINATTGAQIWEYNTGTLTTPGNPPGFSLKLATNTGGVILAFGGGGNSNGTSLSLRKISGTGQVVYNQAISGVLSILNSVTENGDGSILTRIYSASFSGPGDASRFVKWDANGNELMNFTAGTLLSGVIGGFQYFVSFDVALQLANGDVLLVGKHHGPSGTPGVFLHSINSGSVVLWSKFHPGLNADFTHALHTNDGGFLLGGELNNEFYLMKTDALGNVPLPPASCPGNLLANPGFEDILNNWNTTGDVSFQTATPHSGIYAVAVTGSGYASVGQVLPTTPGTSYSLKAWAKYTGNSYRVIELRFLNASWATLPGAAQAEVASSTYAEYTLSGTAPAGAAYVYAIASKDGSGSIEVDDFCLTTGGGSPCSITATVANIQCNDNGTPTNSDDDRFSFILTATNPALSAGYEVFIPQTSQFFQGTYGSPLTIQNVPISTGNLTLNLTDEVTAGCSASVAVTAPAPCSISQNICPGDITLASQAEVDAWPGCTIVEGNLVISGNDITDLSPLSTLQKVRTLFHLKDNALLTDLSGLANLDSVGVLFVTGNAALTNLNGLEGLNQTEIISLQIADNPNLLTINHLNNFVNADFMSIKNNAALQSVSGLSNLTMMDGLLFIEANPSLTNLSGFSSLQQINSQLILLDNDALTQITGFGNLHTLTDLLIISSNENLQHLDGFASLANLEGIVVSSNPSLQNLDAFAPIQSMGGNLIVINNPALGDCCGLYPMLNGGGVGGIIDISGNPMPCSSEQEVLTNCVPSGDIDLSLTLLQLPAAPAQWSNYTVAANVSNAGPETATGVKVKFAKPNGVVYVGGNEFVVSQGSFAPFGNEEWNVGNLPPGTSATLTVSYFLLQNQAPVAYAQVIAANETDADSQPSNGTPPTPNQDDEASTISTPPNLTPDLTIADLQIPNALVQQGQVLNYNFDLSNIGTGAVPGNFTVKSYISTDDVISLDDIQDGTVTTGNYGAGLVVNNVAGATTIPANLAPNIYILIVKVDADNAVTESNENNNRVSANFIVTAGNNCSINAPVVATTCDDNGTPGNPADDIFRLYMTVTGTNTGPAWSVSVNGGNSNFAYGITPLVGAFPISGGAFTLTITDLMNTACSRQVTITPPAPCSNGGGDECGFLKSYVPIPTGNLNETGVRTFAEETASGFNYTIITRDVFTEAVTTTTLSTDLAGNQTNFSTVAAPPPANDEVTATSSGNIITVQRTTASGSVVWTNSFPIDVTGTILGINTQFEELYPVTGGYFVTGTVILQGAMGAIFRPFVIKIGTTGSLIQQNFLSDQPDLSFASDLRASGDGGYYMQLFRSNFLQIFKTDTNGAFLWIQFTASDLPSTDVTAIAVALDGSAVYVAVTDNLSGRLTKFAASDGTMLYQKLDRDLFSPGGPFTNEQVASGLIPTPDGGLVLGFRFYEPGSGNQGFEYGKVDAAGNEVWSHIIPSVWRLWADLQTSDGGFLFIGDHNFANFAMMKVTSEGELTPECGGGGTTSADLSFVSGQISPSSLAVGSTFDLNYIVSNTGGTGANGFEVNYIISTDAVYDLSDGSLGAIGQQSVPADGTLPVFQQVTIPLGTAPGNYYLILLADPDNVVAESNETNNSFPIPLTITSGSGTPDCNAITIVPGTGNVTIAGAVAPHVIIKVFKPNWQIAFECLDGTCSNPQLVSGLNAGNHFVEVKLFDSNWGLICAKSQTVNVIGGGMNLIVPDDRFRLALDKFYPNPVAHWLNVVLFSPKAQTVTLDFYDQQGRRAHTLEMELGKGRNTLELPVGDWKSGTYNVIARGEGLPDYGRFLKVWEE